MKNFRWKLQDCRSATRGNTSVGWDAPQQEGEAIFERAPYVLLRSRRRPHCGPHAYGLLRNLVIGLNAMVEQ
jgi:hypothetical protein